MASKHDIDRSNRGTPHQLVRSKRGTPRQGIGLLCCIQWNHHCYPMAWCYRCCDKGIAGWCYMFPEVVECHLDRKRNHRRGNFVVFSGIIVIAIQLPSGDVSRENEWLRIVSGDGFVTSGCWCRRRYRAGGSWIDVVKRLSKRLRTREDHHHSHSRRNAQWWSQECKWVTEKNSFSICDKSLLGGRIFGTVFGNWLRQRVVIYS